MEKVKISFNTSSLVCLKISAQNNFGNSSKVDLKFLVPLAIMQMQNLKGRQFFRGGNSKFRPTRFCVLLLSTCLQNFKPIVQEIKNLVPNFEIAAVPRSNAMRTRYIYRCQNSESGVDR